MPKIQFGLDKPEFNFGEVENTFKKHELNIKKERKMIINHPVYFSSQRTSASKTSLLYSFFFADVNLEKTIQ